MANIAVIVAVSNYDKETPLPACKKDGDAINQILKATGRFDDILYIADDQETQGALTKELISEFADRHRGGIIDEFFFYFSGHGSFSGEELFLLLKDYSDREKNQTTLQNSELDGIVRSLNPALFVKIIDACESGVNYIKSEGTVGEYLKSTSAGIRGAYFLFSSQSDESSYANSEMSYFTKSIISAVANHKARTIRYRDIISVVSDDFGASTRQTPFFVMQANMTEVFAEVNDNVRKVAMSSLGIVPSPAKPSRGKLAPPPAPAIVSLSDRIRVAAQAGATRIEAEAALNRLSDRLRDVPLSPDTKDLYDQTQEKRESRPTGTKAIGEWLANNQDRGFFAASNKKRESYQKKVLKTGIFSMPNLSRILAGEEDEANYKTVTAYRDVVTGYSLTADIPFEELVIRLEPKVIILTPEECGILPIVSRTHVRLFWSFTNFEYTDWDVAVPRSRTEWFSDEALLKDDEALDTLATRILSAFAKSVDASLAAKWAAQPPTVTELLTTGETPPKGGGEAKPKKT